MTSVTPLTLSSSKGEWADGYGFVSPTGVTECDAEGATECDQLSTSGTMKRPPSYRSP